MNLRKHSRSAFARWRRAAALFGVATCSAADVVPPLKNPRERAEAIRLSEWRVEGATVAEAVDQLRDGARQADPEGREAGFAAMDAGDAATAPRITLNLRNVTVWDALRYTAMAAGLHLRVEENAIVLTRAASTEGRTITRFYPVAPSLLDRARDRAEKRPPR